MLIRDRVVEPDIQLRSFIVAPFAVVPRPETARRPDRTIQDQASG
jgi:hypothetical protein